MNPLKGLYDYDALVRGLKSINSNIEQIQIALAAENKKKIEYEFHINEAKRLLRRHGREDLIDGGTN